MRRFALSLTLLALCACLLSGCFTAGRCGCLFQAVSCRGGEMERSQDVNMFMGNSTRASLGGW